MELLLSSVILVVNLVAFVAVVFVVEPLDFGTVVVLAVSTVLVGSLVVPIVIVSFFVDNVDILDKALVIVPFLYALVPVHFVPSPS